jgi:transcriptional regulator with XRE-family HTH domain
MSFLSLGGNIARYRKGKGITQEELAEFAGVTKASVSKWETGATVPDVQMLPVLAAYFDVTVDELLGYEAQLTKEQIRRYYREFAQSFAEKAFDEVWPESQALVKKYYSCYPLLMQMAVLWLNHCTLAKDDALKNEALAQTEKLCSRIMDGSDNRSLRQSAATVRALVWMQQGKSDRVIKTVEEDALDPNRLDDVNTLLPMAYLSVGNLEMAKKSSQIYLYKNLMELISDSLYLLLGTQGNEAYCREIIDRTDRIIDTYNVSRLNPNTAAGYDYQVAVKLCSFMDPEHPDDELQKQIVDRIGMYVDMVCQLYKDNIRLHGDEFFTTLDEWFSRLDLGPDGVRDGKVIKEDVVSSLDYPAFAMLDDKGRLEQYRRTLQGLAES